MLEPRSPYSSTKAAAELLARSFFTTFGFPVIVTRSSNNFGPYQYPEKVIPLFITNLIDGKKVPLYGDGLNVRDWIHVVDNCEAIDLVLHEGTTGEIYNIGGGEELPNIVLTKKLLALLGKGEESIQHVQDRLGHDRRYSIHTSKVSALGWKPRFSFDEALKQTVEWYQQNEKWWRPLQQRRETVVSSNNEENVSKSNEEKDEDFENVLIIGSSGFLGRKLFDVFSTSEKYSVMGTYYSAEEHEGLIPLDITDVSATRQIITMADPSIILLPGSMTHVDACETDREKAHAINVVGVQNVVSVCKERGIKLVFYSTDYVFDGEKGKYSEEDPANPLGYYGETKILGEEIVRQLSDALICRVAILYGNSSVKKVPFVSWVINSLREGKQIHVYTDLHGSPTLIDDIASATEKLLDNGCVGTYHISGPDCISRYEMALTIAKVFGFDTNLILPSLSSEKPMKARRPKDSSLDITKLKKEGMFTTSFEEGILVLKKQLGLLEDLQ
jgi:dTDP-4-dehydrorhamnose reductase